MRTRRTGWLKAKCPQGQVGPPRGPKGEGGEERRPKEAQGQGRGERVGEGQEEVEGGRPEAHRPEEVPSSPKFKEKVSPQGVGQEARGPPRPLEKGEPKKEGEEKVNPPLPAPRRMPEELKPDAQRKAHPGEDVKEAVEAFHGPIMASPPSKRREKRTGLREGPSPG